jgi:LPXTG-site transpeptidase (sortase) family protein
MSFIPADGEDRAAETNSGRPARRILRKAAVVSGMFAVVAGICVMAIVGFLALAPASEAPQQRHLVISSTEDPGGVYDRPLNVTATPSPSPSPAPPVAAVAPVAPFVRNVPYRLVIDKIGVNAPVATYGLDSKLVPEVPSNGRDVAWYDFTAQPGTGSNAVFAGHVTWSGRGVFYHLDNLAPGDAITLLVDNGAKKLTYTVKDVFLVDPNDPNAVSVMAPTPGSDVATLITCGGDPYYVGGNARYDYTHRLIVRAHLTDVFTAEPAAAGG